MKKAILLLAIITTFISCSKDSSTGCTFNNALFNGKTYKPTKYESNGVDVTASMLALDPCSANSYIFNNNGNWNGVNASGCNQSVETGTWSTTVSGGKNYLVLDGSNQEILSYDCNTFTLNGASGGLSIKATFTKQ